MSGLLRTTARRLYGQHGNPRGALVYVVEDGSLVRIDNLDPFDPAIGCWELLESHLDQAVFGSILKYDDKWGNHCIKLVGNRDEAKNYAAAKGIGVFEIEFVRWVE